MGIASLLLGTPTSGSIDNNATYYLTRPYYGVYVQDDWKVSSRLTLNIGLRYDVQLPYLERYNRQASQFNINQVNPLSNQILAAWNADAASYNAGNPKYPYPAPPSAIYGVWEFAGVNGYPRRTKYTDWTTGAPRIGFAYRVGDKNVIRGGFGVFYQSDTSNNNSQTGFNLTTNYNSTFDNGLTPSACNNPSGSNFCSSGVPTGPYSLVNPFPLGLGAAAGPSAGALANVGQSSTSTTLHYKIPRTYQYSLGIQRQLPKNMVLDVSFAGNYNLYTDYGVDLGHIQDAAGLANQQLAINDPTFFSRSVPNPFVGILPATVGNGVNTTISASSLLNNYPMWNGYTNSDIAGEVFRSDAGQMRFEKRSFSEAGVFTWVFSWTFSKEYALLCCLGNSWQTATGATFQLAPGGTGGTLVTYPLQSPKDNLQYQMDSNNKTQEFAFSGVWDLPIGKGRKFGNSVQGVADKLISGWRMDYIFSYISGFPIGLPGGINYCGDYTHYVDPVTGKRTGQTDQHWFNNNPACYASYPSNATDQQLPPRFSGNVENPAAPQLNFAIEKNTTFGERYKVALRAEAFNITNTAIRPGPGSTTFTSPTFGIIPNNQQNFQRLVQLALRFFF